MSIASHEFTQHRRARRPALRPFVHEALLYHDHATYLDGTMNFIYEGVSLSEPVAVAVPPANVQLIRERLGRVRRGRHVPRHDRRRPQPRADHPLGAVEFADEHAGRRVRIIGEPIWAGRTRGGVPRLRPARGDDQRGVHGPGGDDPLPV